MFFRLQMSMMLLLLMPLVVVAEGLPVVEILTPTEGALLASDADVQALFSTEQFTFVDFKNNTVRFPGDESAGYLRWWLDDAELSADTGERALSVDRPIHLGMLSDGDHELVAELFRNDHSRFDPPIRDRVTFFVGSLPPAAESAKSTATTTVLPLIFLIGLGVFIAYRLLQQRKSA